MATLVTGVSELWAVLRARHIARLRGEVRRPLGQTDASEAPAQAARSQHARPGTLVDASALSGASTATGFGAVARIDPQVLRAVDSASSAEVDSGFEQVAWVQKEYSSVAAIGEEAGDRLVGYVGEEQAVERLNRRDPSIARRG